MTMRRLLSKIFGMVMALAMLVAPAHTQMTDLSARELVRNSIGSHLHFSPNQFLRIERDEELEQSLATAVSRASWSEFIYKASQSGDEIKENVVIHHILMDFDPTYIIAVSPKDGSIFWIHGFGLADSLAEFERLMRAAGLKVSSADQAEYVADFYRAVNPENFSLLNPISSLIDLKQAAERQCQGGLGSFDADQKAFNAWWKRAKPLYEGISFKQTAAPSGGGYVVEWIVLSSAGPGNCGGAPLRARLEVSSDGQVGKVTFSPLHKS